MSATATTAFRAHVTNTINSTQLPLISSNSYQSQKHQPNGPQNWKGASIMQKIPK